ncbi:MAG: hypothetical protein AUK63_1197 [bacterium P3]|nr:MAG: hypothetical protein AUK63_1197 [bacterium P3]
MDKNCNRNYGFKHISEEYKWMTHNWTKELAKHEPDLEVRDYVTEILEDLTTPEKSRLVSSTDKFDCLEEYWEKKLEDDEVYKWLMTSIDFFAKNDAFELCYNIQKAIEIIRKFIADSEKNHAEPVAIDSYGLPF